MGALEFDKRAQKVKTLVKKHEGKEPASFSTDGSITSAKNFRGAILEDMEAAVQEMKSLRTGNKDRKPVDISLGQYVQERWGFAASESGTPESFLQALNIEPSRATISSLQSMDEFSDGYRWLIPEVIREAVRLGIRKAPLYPNLIAAEESVTQPTVTMPHINMSDAMPSKIGEAESIGVGTTSYGEKNVKLQKLGTGLKITDEVSQYVSLNVLSLYLQDVGSKLNIGLDSMAIDTLINGDQANGSNAAAVIGVEATGDGFTYYDLLRAWIRMGMLGRLPQSILSNENPALDILMLNEFRNRDFLANPQNLNMRTPIPQTTNYDIHGAMPADDKIMLIDNTSALIKLNAQALNVESERIASRQLNGTYVTLTTGYANLFNDARIIMDKSIAFSGNGFPATMNPTGTLSESFKD